MAKYAGSLQDIVSFALEGASRSDIAGASLASVKELADNMTNDLQQGLDNSTAADLNPKITIKHSEPTPITSGKKTLFQFDLIAEGDLYRPSLMEDEYGGVNNIIKLLNDGYTLKHKGAHEIIGSWNGSDDVRPRISRAGAKFLDSLKARYDPQTESIDILI